MCAAAHEVFCEQCDVDDVAQRNGLEVAQGVAYLHQSQVIHRDIKSANVLLDAHQHAKVTDFGISTRFALDHTAETGTYRYMAPEVIAHQQYDYRCDVYSYGMLLWEIAHQQVPFRSQNALQAAFAVAMEQKRPPLSLSVALAGFGPVITACWQSSAEQRPDMDRVVQQLQVLDEAAAAAAAPPPPPGGASCVVALLPQEQAAATSTDGQGAELAAVATSTTQPMWNAETGEWNYSTKPDAELAAVATSRTLPSWDGGMAGAPTGFDSCNP